MYEACLTFIYLLHDSEALLSHKLYGVQFSSFVFS